LKKSIFLAIAQTALLTAVENRRFHDHRPEGFQITE
jgi:hypothetical protein